MEKPDRPAAPSCPLAYTSSETSAYTREYFRGGSRLKQWCYWAKRCRFEPVKEFARGLFI